MSDVALEVSFSEGRAVGRVGELPAAPALARAVVGFLVAGVAAGLGATDPETAVRAVPSGLMVGCGALVLTAPALVVGHQYLGLEARPVALVASLGDGFVRAGRFALGFSPLLGFFSLTTSLWLPLAALVAASVALVGFTWSAVGLRAVEPGSMRMDGLVVAWTVLAGLVALRLAVEVSTLVLG